VIPCRYLNGGGKAMARAYSSDLRVRVIEAINGGFSTRQAAALFSIGIATAGAWHRFWRKTGEAKPLRRGNPGGSKLDAYADFILGLIAAQKDITLHEIAAKLLEEQGLKVQPSTLWYFLDRRGMTFKKRRRMPPNRSARMSPRRGKPGAKASQVSIPRG
jgi:transposase